MEVVGSYEEDGYALLRHVLDRRVAQAFLTRVTKDLGRTALPLTGAASRPAVLDRPVLQVYGRDYPPMQFFLWGLTPLMSRLTGRELLPTYGFFRVYRAGDILRVHSDREACEHSLSLTLDYSDGLVWPLEVGTRALSAAQKDIAEDFDGEEHASLEMEPGDAVLYRGTHRRHGRTEPNPNRWSAHLFCHWVERDGRYADRAFDGAQLESAAQINFA
ncbi:MAG: hypothetical protein QOI38_33 [Sphingomonadales bacterium]|jgi:hypothetical protein|nr:hypothetical protein [Sphingomonadales bacterium]